MSVSCDQRLCPGVGGRTYGAFMFPLFRDPHPTCARCRGVKCTSDVTCDICKDWSVVQWETFLQRRPSSELRQKRLSGAALPSAPPTLTPCASPFLQRGMTARGRRRVSPVWVLARSPLPPLSGRGEGGCREGLGFCRRNRFDCFLPPGGRGSRIITLRGVSCALQPFPGRLFHLCRR